MWRRSAQGIRLTCPSRQTRSTLSFCWGFWNGFRNRFRENLARHNWHFCAKFAEFFATTDAPSLASKTVSERDI